MAQAFVPDVQPTLLAALRGESPAWPWDPAGGPAAARLLALAAAHGVEALLFHRLRGAAWPAEVLAALRERSVAQAVWELKHQQLLAQLLPRLAAERVQPVLIKGTALAYTLYPDPALRTRSDTDLLIRPDDREPLHRALLAAGFRAVPVVSGEFVSYQASYARREASGLHALDVHWRINNSEVLSQLFTYEELRGSAVAVPALAPHAWAPALPHALLIACMHMAAHRSVPYLPGTVDGEPDRLIWLADLDLLARRLAPPQWAQALEMGTGKGLLPVLRETLALCEAAWHTPLPPEVRNALAHARPGRASAYLAAGRARQRWMDWMALPDSRARLRLLRETVFPPASYMRERFGAAPLPWLYLRRAWRGVARRWHGS